MDVSTEHLEALNRALEHDESVRSHAPAGDSVLAVTDRRLVVASQDRIALAVPLQDVRRVQFDIERDRPATLVVVPEQAHHEPQVLSIRPEDYRAAADALVIIGIELAGTTPGER
jgi:hypothetical protein